MKNVLPVSSALSLDVDTLPEELNSIPFKGENVKGSRKRRLFALLLHIFFYYFVSSKIWNSLHFPDR
jgi:hypothetical protein